MSDTWFNLHEGNETLLHEGRSGHGGSTDAQYPYSLFSSLLFSSNSLLEVFSSIVLYPVLPNPSLQFKYIFSHCLPQLLRRANLTLTAVHQDHTG